MDTLLELVVLPANSLSELISIQVVAIYSISLLTIVDQVIYLTGYLVSVMLVLSFPLMRILKVVVGVAFLRVEYLHRVEID